MLNNLPYKSGRLSTVAYVGCQPYVLVVNDPCRSSRSNLIAYCKSNPVCSISPLRGKARIISRVGAFQTLIGVDMLHVSVEGNCTGIIVARRTRSRGLLATRCRGAHASAQSIDPCRNELIRSKLTRSSRLFLRGVRFRKWWQLRLIATEVHHRLWSFTQREITTGPLERLARVEEKFAVEGSDVVPGSPAQYKDFITKELDRWGTVIKKAGIKLAD